MHAVCGSPVTRLVQLLWGSASVTRGKRCTKKGNSSRDISSNGVLSKREKPGSLREESGFALVESTGYREALIALPAPVYKKETLPLPTS
jgi:hypothetical protein